LEEETGRSLGLRSSGLIMIDSRSYLMYVFYKAFMIISCFLLSFLAECEKKDLASGNERGENVTLKRYFDPRSEVA
jgi:hypothetical protein